jgi:hypothetical protein
MGMRNRRRLIAFVVGHEKWGKTFTLRALCGRTAKRVTIGEVEFFVRRSSNDDIQPRQPDKYIKFIHSLSAPFVIAALCPKFKKISKSNLRQKFADDLLKTLQRKGYRLFFWVIKYQWGRPHKYILPKEISKLRKYGRVRVYEGVDVKDRVRAKKFRSFVLSIL